MEYLIVNLDRQFWTGKNWNDNRASGWIYRQLTTAIEVAEPLTFKSYVVSNYGRYDEKEEYRNFGDGPEEKRRGRSIIFGRHEGW